MKKEFARFENPPIFNEVVTRVRLLLDVPEDGFEVIFLW
jgi:hypothetical protein